MFDRPQPTIGIIPNMLEPALGGYCTLNCTGWPEDLIGETSRRKSDPIPIRVWLEE